MISIDYVVNARLPTEKAHGLQVMRQCEAFGAAGVDLRLYHALRFQSREMRLAADPFRYYGCPPFPARSLPTLDLQLPLDPLVGRQLRRGLFLLQSASFAAWATVHAAAPRGRWIYTRDPYYAAALAALGAGHRTVFEAHRAPERGRRSFLAMLRRLAGVVSVTEGLAAELTGLPRVLVAPDGVRLEDYRELPEPEVARQRLGLPPERPLAVYTGHLFGWKGVDTLVRAAAELPGLDLLILGGLDADRRRLVQRLRPTANVHLRAHVPPGEVPAVLAAASVLVLPNSAASAHSRTYTSPMKLFEYMASDRPIVASDLPSLREVLEPDRTAVLVPPDQPRALAAALQELVDNPALGRRLAAAARRRVTDFTWSRRTERILQFLLETARLRANAAGK